MATPPSQDTIIAAGRRVAHLEASALVTLADSLDERFAGAVELIASLKGRAVLAGIGKSGHVARKIAATLASTGTPSLYVHPTEASHGDMGMITREDAVIALSKSGETAELSDLIHYCKRYGVPLIAITAGRDSTLGRSADILLLLPDAPEACAETRAPTTSTTLQIALGDCLAVALLEKRGFTSDNFRIFHPGGKLGAMLRTVGDLMHSGADMPLIPESASMAGALLEMTTKTLGCVGVTGPDGALVGMITDGDLRRKMSADLPSRAVTDLMTRAPKTLTADLLAAEALRRMNELKITQVFVVAGGQPVGVLHLHDLLRAGVG